MPSRACIGGRLLAEEVGTQQKRLTEWLGDKLVTMSLDAWTNDANVPVVACCVDRELLHAWETVGKPHTGEYMCQLMRDGLGRAHNLGIHVCAIVTDGASNMQLARSLLNKVCSAT